MKLKLVASFARPGGNLTGVNFLNTELVAKQLGLLRELVPGTARVAVLVNQTNITAETTLKTVEAAALAMGLQLQTVSASTSAEINSAFANLGREHPDALFVGGDGFFNSRRVQLVNLASRYLMPASYAERIFPEIGGLISYGSDVTEAFRQIGVYAGRILKGEKPADLPVVAAEQVRAGHQSRDRQGARPRSAADAARPRRRGDRMSAPGKAGAIQPVEVRPK